MQTKKNHRIIVPRRGDPEVLQWVEDDLPVPEPGEVRIAVETAGVSGYDIMLRQYWFPGFPKVPYTPGEDVVGVVDAVGDGVVDFARGQRVAAWTFGDAGGYTEYLCRPANELVPVPDELDPAIAASLVTNYLTAHIALHMTARVSAGERILVHGAGGGVGSALLQLGKLLGVEMFGTGTGPALDLIAANGATGIDYQSENFLHRIRELTGDGVDAVFDVIGGPRQLHRSYRCLRGGGRLLMLGIAGTARSGIRIILPSLLVVGALSLWPDGKSIPMSPNMQSYPRANLSWYRETLGNFFSLAVDGDLVPAVAARVPLHETARAHASLKRGGHPGKTVLTSLRYEDERSV